MNTDTDSHSAWPPHSLARIPGERVLHTADVVVPFGGLPPVVNGGVILDSSGRVISVGPVNTLGAAWDRRVDHNVLLPGFSNAHVHMTDAQCTEPVPGGKGLPIWVRELMDNRASRGNNDADLSQSIKSAILSMREGGTVAIGEVVNNSTTRNAIRETRISCRLIHELIGFTESRSGEIFTASCSNRDALPPDATMLHSWGIHAPYSTSLDLAQLVSADALLHGDPWFIHLAEDAAERELYSSQNGPWRELLESLGIWIDGWSPPATSPIASFDALGLLGPNMVAVHLTDATDAEIALLAERGVRVILSPTSNLHITQRLPPFEQIIACGMPFAFGTDGRGSNASVDVVDEARQVMERWPDLAPGRILNALVSTGAEILGFEELGGIVPGRIPGLVAVDVRSGIGLSGRLLADIERELVLGRSPRKLVDWGISDASGPLQSI